MIHNDLIFAIESAIESIGLESVLRLIADTVAEKADSVSGNMGFGIDSDSGDDWSRAADMIRAVSEAIPDSTR